MVGERLLFVLVALAATPVVAAEAQVAWQIEVRDGVRLKSRELEPGVFEVVAEGHLDATVQDVEDVLSRIELYPRFMPYVKETRVLAKRANATRAYTRIGFPFMYEPRDYVTETLVHESSKRGNTFRCTFLSFHDALPEVPEVIRVKTLEGEWVARGMGPRTHVTYRFVAAPGGAELPSFAQQFARREAALKVFDAIEREANDRAFERRTYAGRRRR